MNPKCYRHKPKSCGCQQMANVRPQKLSERRTGFASTVADGQLPGEKSQYFHTPQIYGMLLESVKTLRPEKGFHSFRGRLKSCNITSTCENSAALTVGSKRREVRRAEGFDRGWPLPTGGQHLHFQAVQHRGPQVGHREHVMILKINTSLQFSDHQK